MTDKYIAYLQLLAERDQIVMTLALLAAGMVIAWQIPIWLRLSRRWLSAIQTGMLIGGLALYGLTLYVLATTPLGG